MSNKLLFILAKLNEISTKPPSNADKEQIAIATQGYLEKMHDLQDVLFAESKHSVLIVLQGVDTAGKDSTIKKVFTGINPMGCDVKSWKVPTAEERQYDFLWRIHRHVPPKGMIHIFNRSHYEDVIVPRVKCLIPDEQIRKRYNFINGFEQLLVEENSTLIFKFYLHISHEEQYSRLEKRTSDPRKLWKYDPSDMKVYNSWNNYIAVYEEIFKECSNALPWHIIPADKKWYRDYLVAKAIVEGLEGLEMKYPG